MGSQTNDDGIVFAETRDGHRLPVIDVTHPRFHVPDNPETYQRMLQKVERGDRQRRWLPKFLMRWMMKSAAKKSRLVATLFSTDKSFLDGISTYVMKLGADNLVPPFDTPMDRRLARSPHIAFLRLRTQQVATLLSEGLMGPLQASGAPLHLINIAGGPAIDSLNALILLSRLQPDLLRRKITIDVLDRDDAGAFFGLNALKALQGKGRHLAGLDITFTHHAYNWEDTSLLVDLIDELAGRDAVIAASSEGGLFEYGSDQAIIENLKALNAGGRGARCIVGSVTRNDEMRRQMIKLSGFKLVPRGIEGFRPLADEAGLHIVETLPTILSDQILLLPAPEAGKA